MAQGPHTPSPRQQQSTQPPAHPLAAAGHRGPSHAQCCCRGQASGSGGHSPASRAPQAEHRDWCAGGAWLQPKGSPEDQRVLWSQLKGLRTPQSCPERTQPPPCLVQLPKGREHSDQVTENPTPVASGDRAQDPPQQSRAQPDSTPGSAQQGAPPGQRKPPASTGTQLPPREGEVAGPTPPLPTATAPPPGRPPSPGISGPSLTAAGLPHLQVQGLGQRRAKSFRDTSPGTPMSQTGKQAPLFLAGPGLESSSSGRLDTGMARHGQ